MGAIAANSYAIGVADIYGELREGGSEANDMGSRFATLAGAFPYALLESLPEIFIGARFLKGTGKGGLGYRAGKVGEGIAAGGLLEGITETGQEEIIMSIDSAVNDTETTSDEMVKRRWNSFWAGFGIGGPIGGLASLRAGEPTDLLKRDGEDPASIRNKENKEVEENLDEAAAAAEDAERPTIIEDAEQQQLEQDVDLTDQDVDLTDLTDFDQAAINQEELKDEAETDAINVKDETITDEVKDVPEELADVDKELNQGDVNRAIFIDDAFKGAAERKERKSKEEGVPITDTDVAPVEEDNEIQGRQYKDDTNLFMTSLENKLKNKTLVTQEEIDRLNTIISEDIEYQNKAYRLDEIARRRADRLQGKLDEIQPADPTDLDPIIREEQPKDSLSDYETIANFVSQNIYKPTSPDWPDIAGLHILNIGGKSNIQGWERSVLHVNRLKKGSNIAKGDNIFFPPNRYLNRDPETGRVSTITITQIEDPNTKKLIEVAEVIVNPNPVVFDLTLSEKEQKERYSDSLFWRKMQEDKQRDLKTEKKKQEVKETAAILKRKKKVSPKKVSPLGYGIPEPKPAKVIPIKLRKKGKFAISFLDSEGKPIRVGGLNSVYTAEINKLLKKQGIGLDELTLELQQEIINDLISKGDLKTFETEAEKGRRLRKGKSIRKYKKLSGKAKPVTGSELVSMPPELMLNSNFFNLFVKSKAVEQFKFDSFKEEFFKAGSKVKEQEKVYVKYFLNDDYNNNQRIFDRFVTVIQEQINIYEESPNSKKSIPLERLYDWRAAFAKHAIESGRNLTPIEFTYHMDSIVQPIVGFNTLVKQSQAKTKGGELKFKNIEGESLINWSAANLFNGDTALNNVQKSVLYNQFIVNFMELNKSVTDGNIPPTTTPKGAKTKWFAFLEQIDAAAAGEDKHQKLGTKLYKAIIASGVINDANGKPSQAKLDKLIKTLDPRQVLDWDIRLEISDDHADSNDEDEDSNIGEVSIRVNQIQDKLTKLINWDSANYREFNRVRKEAENTIRKVVKAMNGEKGHGYTETTAEQIWHSWLSMPRQYSQFYNMLDPESDMTEIQVSQLWDTENDRLYSLDRWVYPSEYNSNLSIYKFANTPTPKVIVPKTIYDLSKEDPNLGKKVTESYRQAIRGVKDIVTQSEHTQIPVDAYEETIEYAKNKIATDGFEYNKKTKNQLNVYYLRSKYEIPGGPGKGDNLKLLLNALTSDYILDSDGKPIENPDGSGKIGFDYGPIIRRVLFNSDGKLRNHGLVNDLYEKDGDKLRPKIANPVNQQKIRKVLDVLIGKSIILYNNPAVNIGNIDDLAKHIDVIVKELEAETLGGSENQSVLSFRDRRNRGIHNLIGPLKPDLSKERHKEISAIIVKRHNAIIDGKDPNIVAPLDDKEAAAFYKEELEGIDKIVAARNYKINLKRGTRNRRLVGSIYRLQHKLNEQYIQLRTSKLDESGIEIPPLTHAEAKEELESVFQMKKEMEKGNISEKGKTAIFKIAARVFTTVKKARKQKTITPAVITKMAYDPDPETVEVDNVEQQEVDELTGEILEDHENPMDIEPRKRLRKQGEKPRTTLNKLQFQSVISSVLRKLRVKPKVKVFNTINDLISNPNVDDIVKISLTTPGFDINTWYNAEVLTDLEKGFPSFVKYARELQKMGIKQPSSIRVKDRVEGISYGNEVYIIADQIKSKDHLKTVLAHEAIGHFGLRSIIEPKKLNSILEDIYKNTEENDPFFHNLVKKRIALNDTLSISEAVEETLADEIEIIETSLIKKLIHLILSAFDRLGIPLADGMETRYLINQARRYVRGGDTRIGIYSSQAIRDNVAKQKQYADIRFHLRGDANDRANIENLVHSNSPGHSRSPKQLIELAKKTGINIKNKGFWRSLKQFSQTTNNHARVSFGLSQVYEAMSDIGAMRNSLLNSYAGLRPLMNKLREWGVLNKVGTERDKINERHSNQLTEASLRLQLDKLDSFYSEQDINKALASGKIIEFFRDYNKYVVRDGYTKSDQDLRMEDVNSYSTKHVTETGSGYTTFKSGWWVISKVLDSKQLVNRETLRINKDVWKVYEDFLPTFEEIKNYMKTDPVYKARDKVDKPSGIKAILAERKEKGLGDLGDIPWKLYLEGRLTVSESKKDVYLNTVSGYYQLIAAQTNEFFDQLSQSYIEKANLDKKDFIELENDLKKLQKSIRNLSFINFDMDKYKQILRDTNVKGVKGSKVDKAITTIRKFDKKKHYLTNFIRTVFYKYQRSMGETTRSKEALAYMPIALKMHTEIGLTSGQLTSIIELFKTPDQLYKLFTEGSDTIGITINQGKQLNNIYKEIVETEDGLGGIDHTQDYKKDKNYSHINPDASEKWRDIISKDVIEIAEAYEIINAVRTLADAIDKGKNVFTRTEDNPVTSNDIALLELPEGLVEQIDNLIQASGSLINNAHKSRPAVDKNFNVQDSKIDYQLLKKYQDTLIDLLIETSALQNEVRQLEQTMITTYFPLRRRGDWFMKSEIGNYNKNNVWVPYISKDGVHMQSLNAVQWTQNLPYMQGTKSEMIAKQEELNNYFKDEEITIDGQAFLVRSSVAKVEKETIEPFFETDLRQTLMMFRRLNIDLNSKQKEALVKQLSSEYSSLRRGLRREFVPGWDDNLMRNQVEYSTANAHISAKMKHYHRVTRAIDNKQNWTGDRTKLRNLENEYNRFGDYVHGESKTKTAGRIVAKHAYDDYRYKYKHSADINPENYIVDDNGKKIPTLGRGAEYKDIAVKLWDHFRSDQGSENLIDDWLNSNPVGRKLKALAVTSQLGGTAAAGIINFGTMVTHAPAVLATYNPERGFGGGFGFAKASAELIRALKDVGGIRFGRLDDLEIIVKKWKDKSKSEHGLTYDEANFLLDETKSGMLSAAEPRAWLGMARQGPGGQIGFKVQEAWMSWFGYTEKLNRRSTALAAYRLFRGRGESAGKTGKDLNNYISRHTNEIVSQAQGDYTLPNRPEWGRTPFGQYLYIYKTFQIITVQLLWNLPLKGKLTMLGMLFLFAGLKGLPFGEDMIDLVDSAGARLGVTRGNIELAAKQILEETVPGSSKLVMRGALDTMGWTWSSRLSMGNLIPATGMFRVGRGPAEYSRDSLDFAGPVASNTKGLIQSINMLYNYFTSQLSGTPSPDIADILKKNPIAGLRNIADSVMYYKDGTITNARGKVMVPDVTVNEMIGRFVGFYPARAHLQNTAIKLSKYHLSYNRDIKSRFVNQYVQAKLVGDTGKMQSVIDAVHEWNANVPEEYKIVKFFSSANTSFKANQKAAWDRFRATVGNRNQFIKMIGEIHSMEDILD